MAGSEQAKPQFRVERMTSTDWSDMLRPCNRRGGDLATAPLPLCWPAPEGDRADDEVLRRLEYSTAQQKKWFDTDPTAHFVKAVTEDGEIACMGRWNYFPRGYDIERNRMVAVTDFAPSDAIAPLGPFQITLYQDLVHGMMALRQEWMPKGPSWVLMAMVTRECYRRQGAASMIVLWGVKRAHRDSIPAYLEASASGKPVYESCGFRQVGELVPWELRPYGTDMVFQIAKMAWHPESDPQSAELVSSNEQTNGPELP